MNISKGSWHYRLLSKLDMISGYKSESLCPYFWKVAAAVVLLPTLVLAIAWFLTIPLWWSFTNIAVQFAIIIGMIDVTGLSILLGILIRDRREREVEEGTREAPTNVYKPPSLFRLWLKARHEQVCPMIEFED